MSLGVPIWFISNLWLTSCHSQEEVSSFGNIQEIPKNAVWTLQSQKQIFNHERPPWMNTDCNTEPCLKEVWTKGSKTHTTYWSDERYFWSENKHFKTRWRGLNGVLFKCLGHPYSVPVALDPAGTREYVEPDTWNFTLSGNNRCALSGTLQLAVNKERINFKELKVQGLPWAQGGLSKARELLHTTQSSPLDKAKTSQ